MGNIGSYLAQSFPPKSKFDIADVPDLTGKIIIVTGKCLKCPGLHSILLLWNSSDFQVVMGALDMRLSK